MRLNCELCASFSDISFIVPGPDTSPGKKAQAKSGIYLEVYMDYWCMHMWFQERKENLARSIWPSYCKSRKSNYGCFRFLSTINGAVGHLVSVLDMLRVRILFFVLSLDMQSWQKTHIKREQQQHNNFHFFMWMGQISFLLQCQAVVSVYISKEILVGWCSVLDLVPTTTNNHHEKIQHQDPWMIAAGWVAFFGAFLADFLEGGMQIW